MSDLHYDVVIVGAGHGGAQTAVALRQRGFAGSIVIVGDEPELPYERPPLSKEYLAGEKGFERLLIRPPHFWMERQVELLTGRRVVAVKPRTQTIVTATGEAISYGELVWAAGGAPRRLACAGHDLAGVHTIRRRADVDAMIAELGAIRQVCVIGGGYIGLEAAAVLTKLGRQVTILEAQDRLLARVAGPVLSRFYEAEHRARGVEIRLGVGVRGIVGSDGRAGSVQLSDGQAVTCDMAIVGIGIEPAIEPLRDAGAECANGVMVDPFCRTTLAHVYAIGDCARHRSAFADGADVRLESVQNANEMAGTVAKAITGQPSPYEVAPWFWSNQYDLKLQTVGLSIGYDREIVRGDPAARSFSVIYMRKGRVAALDCVNTVSDFVQGKKLLLADGVSPQRLASPDIPLKEIAAAI